MPVHYTLFREKSGDTALQTSMQSGASNSLGKEENKLAFSNVLNIILGVSFSNVLIWGTPKYRDKF